MSQQWLNVAGLALDFLGVLVLAVEWWLALQAEARESALEEQHRRMQPSPMMPRPQVPMQQVFDHMRDQQRLRERAERAAGTRGIRRSVFAGAFMLVAAGFLLQILGSWPGCCSQVGIVPSGG